MRVYMQQIDGSNRLIDSEELQAYLNDQLHLTCQGTVLTSENLENTLFEDCTVHASGALEGGKRKKKKKVYTTKKKNKHIHKKISKLFLSLYKVDGKGVVTPENKTCPSCGPGTYMAKHWDRYYCGLCHTTIKLDAETIKKNEEILKKKRAALEAEKKAKQKDAPLAAGKAGKGKDTKKKKK